ncbi:hypothetical protein [Streptomyces sp. NRRL B-24572]|uniref:hypothetical protein n=1 Tax=Streptomyces sp. NRRL B-24572 TaxID=1962156 RepID=UPI000A3CEF96|nr:hypothetical protein [Streptomyces sp. NRRL B-24572]
MPRSSRRVGLALIAVLAGGAAAVGGAMLSSSEAAPAPSDGALATAAGLDRLHGLPPVTDRMFGHAEVLSRSAEAQRQYSIACMAEHGFRYAPPPTPTPAEDGDQRPRPFGLEAPPSAAPARKPLGETPPKPGSEAATKAYQRALFGDEDRRVSAKGAHGMAVTRPGDGCLAEAEKRVLGDGVGGRMRWLQVRILLFEAQEQARANVEKDPAFRNATARWQQCMNDYGFPGQRDPSTLLKTLPTQRARLNGRDILKADLRCKGETGYLTIAYTRLAAVQQGWLDRNPAVEKDWRKLLDRQDKAAREVLATKPPVPSASAASATSPASSAPRSG